MLRASLRTCLVVVAIVGASMEAATGQQILSDHGMTAGEPYDANGNPLDRHGTIVAAPEGRTQGREVFATRQKNPR